MVTVVVCGVAAHPPLDFDSRHPPLQNHSGVLESAVHAGRGACLDWLGPYHHVEPLSSSSLSITTHDLAILPPSHDTHTD